MDLRRAVTSHDLWLASRLICLALESLGSFQPVACFVDEDTVSDAETIASCDTPPLGTNFTIANDRSTFV